MNKRTWTDEQLIEAFNTSRSVREILSKLNLIEAGGNYKSIQVHMMRLNLDKQKLLGPGWRKGQKNPVKPAKPLTEILINGSSYRTSQLRLRLIKENIFEYKCFSCKLTEWLDSPISLELDHINGDNFDNRLENLRLLCPNCHAQTDTYRGKNIKKYKEKNKQKPKVKPIKIKTNKFCIQCNTQISSKSTRCKKCVIKLTKINWPNNEDLLQMLSKSNYTQVGKKLGVSDNAIRKHLRA